MDHQNDKIDYIPLKLVANYVYTVALILELHVG